MTHRTPQAHLRYVMHVAAVMAQCLATAMLIGWVITTTAALIADAHTAQATWETMQ